MFLGRYPDLAETVTIHLDGAAVAAPRGPYRMIGTCFGCLAALDDGRPSQAAQ